MTFWILTALVTFAIAALLAAVLLRNKSTGEPAAAFDLRVYRQQLADVDKDVARGVVAHEDAERIRTEIARRILAADAQLKAAVAGTAQPTGATQIMAAIVVAVIATGTAVLYLHFGAPGYGDFALADRLALAEERATDRPSQTDIEAQMPPQLAPEISADYLNLVTQLRSVMETRPEDPRGFALLSEHEANLGNFRAAYTAKARYIELQNNDIDGDDLMDMVELMTLAAGGYISPEAETYLRQALTLEGRRADTGYYFGLLMGQIGRPDRGYQVWSDTLKIGPAGSPWIQRIQAQIPDMAALAGVNYTEITPPSGEDRRADPPLPNPSAEDIEAASALSAEDRMEMVRGMVSQLSERLATEGGSVEEWARLIASLGVLGQPEQAAAIYSEAVAQFSEDDTALSLLQAAAKSAGVDE